MTTNDTERQEVLELLPWYANQTLDQEETERVRRYLDAHPELEPELVQTETILGASQGSASVPMLSHDRMNRLMERIDDEAPPRPSWFERCRAWLSDFTGEAGTPSWAAGAAAAALVMAIVLVLPTPNPGPGEYGVLSNQDSWMQELVLEFSSATNAADRAQLLQTLALPFKQDSATVYRLSVTDDMSPKAVSALLERVRSDPRVTQANIALRQD